MNGVDAAELENRLLSRCMDGRRHRMITLFSIPGNRRSVKWCSRCGVVKEYKRGRVWYPGCGVPKESVATMAMMWKAAKRIALSTCSPKTH